MATVMTHPAIEQIGVVAGEVWKYLEINGPTSFTKLGKEIDAPRDTVMQAVGWLAREDKVVIEEEGRSRVVALR